MRRLRTFLGLLMMMVMLAAPLVSYASGHREAPLTALDHAADITDVFAFRSYNTPKVTLIMCLDPFLEPGNGPNWFPFDPDISYELKVDNNDDAKVDIRFIFRFTTEQRLPNFYQAYAGVAGGANAPNTSPSPVPPGTQIVPPKITSFNDTGLGTRQSYTVQMVKNGVVTDIKKADLSPFYAVPANTGPRTMDYPALFSAGTYTAANNIRVFAGTVDDPFWADVGGFFDTLNTHKSPFILSAPEDAAYANLASDTLSGYAVNAIAIEVPISLLTRTGNIEPANSTAATIGVWGYTARPAVTTRNSPNPTTTSGPFKPVQRMGNPFINSLLIGTGFKDRFSMDLPINDSQFKDPFFTDPTLARVVNALSNGSIAIPPPPRNDLLPLFTYAPPIAAAGTPPGPTADLLRLNTGVAATMPGSESRLGLLGGDPAGFPNGRRPLDDVTDIMLRLVAGGVLAAPFTGYDSNTNGRLGDGVNVNDAPYHSDFPYLADCPSGRDRRHIDPGEPGCTAGSGGACLP
jgi:hypothetical protein